MKEHLQKRGFANASLLLGFFSLIPSLMPFTVIPAIVTGHIARRLAVKFPLEYTGKRMAAAGLILGYSSLIVLFFLIRALNHSEEKAYEISCRSNLRCINIAMRMYAKGHSNSLPTELRPLGIELANVTKVLMCPKDDRKPPPDFEVLTSKNISYEYLAAGLTNLAQSTNVPLMRCPIHNLVLLGNDSVVKGLERAPADIKVQTQ